MITFLDCTLRDGGYYNDWDFDPKQAASLVNALNEAGAQIIEVGYKAPVNTQKYFGLFKNCNEEYLGFLSKDDSAEYAFMIDVKEFILQDGTANRAELDKQICDAGESVFSWVRMASHFATINSIAGLTDYFHSRGYKVGFNLMGGSLLTESQLKSGSAVAQAAGVEVFYIADSFGSFYPEDIRRILGWIRSEYNGKIGIHTHDNQGMAYANTLVAIEEGVSFVDGTVTGMGRGSGNLLTEQFLLGYALKYGDQRYDASALLHIIESYIQPMKDQHRWGYNYSYMYSGLRNIHPTYGQQLATSDRYTSSEIGHILANIPAENRSKYQEPVLRDAIKREINRSGAGEGESEKSPNVIHALKDKPAFILAKGPEAKAHIPTLVQVAGKMQGVILECNDTGYIQEEGAIKVILNQLKLQEYLESDHGNDSAELYTGRPLDEIEKDRKWNYFPFRIGPFDTANDYISIPDYDAGLFALGLAIRSGASAIYLAGFDGFTDAELHASRQALLQQVKEHARQQGVEIKHVTRSRYAVFAQQSLYIL